MGWFPHGKARAATAKEVGWRVVRGTKSKLTSGGLFRKGRDALLSAFMTTTDLALVVVVAGANADADPTSAARVAAAFIIVAFVFFCVIISRGGARRRRDDGEKGVRKNRRHRPR